MSVKLKNGQLDAFLFERDWILNERVAGWPRGVLEIYMTLLCEGWALPEAGVFPDDDQELARLAHCSLKRWRRGRPHVMAEFEVAPALHDAREPYGSHDGAETAPRWSRDGMLVHRRMDAVAAEQRSYLMRQSEQRRGAANALWAKKNGRGGENDGPVAESAPTHAVRNAGRVESEPEIDAARDAGVGCGVLGVGKSVESKGGAARADSTRTATATAAARGNVGNPKAGARSFHGGNLGAQRVREDIERAQREPDNAIPESSRAALVKLGLLGDTVPYAACLARKGRAFEAEKAGSASGWRCLRRSTVSLCASRSAPGWR